MSQFNPNDIGLDNGNLFGLPSNFSQSAIAVLPVPWDVTVSYRDGTSGAPDLIREESMQVDLYDLEFKNFWEQGIYYLKSSEAIQDLSRQHRPYAIEVIKLLEKGYDSSTNAVLKSNIDKVNSACKEMVDWVYTESLKVLNQNKKLLLLGGDHSTPLGYLRALSEVCPGFGILQIDAHCDLRDSYEGFKYSHASIMYNAMQLAGIDSLIQVGVRDFCEDEVNYVRASAKPIHIFYDRTMAYQKIEGNSWKSITDEIIEKLPSKLYISFDIDGLKPYYCPNTGTPVPGGLDLDEVFYLLGRLRSAGKEVIGMDLNEVGLEVWDANVGARALYRMLGLWLS